MLTIGFLALIWLHDRMKIWSFVELPFYEQRFTLVEFLRLRTYLFTKVTETTIYPGPLALNAAASLVIIFSSIITTRYLVRRITRPRT